MIQDFGALLYQKGDLGNGWEIGPVTEQDKVWDVTKAEVIVSRVLYRMGKDKGRIFGLCFADEAESIAATTTLKPFVTSPAPGQMPGGRPEPLALLGNDAFGGVSVFRIPGMEQIGITPVASRNILFRRGKTVIFIRCQDLTEEDAYECARNIDKRLTARDGEA